MHEYLYIPFFLCVGGFVLFLLHKMSLSLGADVKVVWTPAFLRARLSCGAISGMYCMQAYGLFSSWSPRRSLRKGRTLKRSRMSASMGVECCLWVCGVFFRCSFCALVGGV